MRHIMLALIQTHLIWPTSSPMPSVTTLPIKCCQPSSASSYPYQRRLQRARSQC